MSSDADAAAEAVADGKLCALCSAFRRMRRKAGDEKSAVDAALKAYTHVCTANWVGSSKSMEAGEAVAMCKRLPELGARAAVICMDDDASTRAHVRP
jgi:hypothetical protein